MQQSSDEVRHDPVFFFWQAEFFFAERDAFHEERHVACERAHGLEAFGVFFRFAWHEAVDAVPVLAGDDGHAGDCEILVEFVECRGGAAAALSIDAVLITPTCCDPLYRRAVRVSMGTVFQVPWTRIGSQPSDWPQPGIQRLRELGFRTAAMALSDTAVSIEDQRLCQEEKLAIVLGTEGDGLSPRTIADCDYIVRIPMSHEVDSLNVAAASAVAFWQLRAR